MENECFSKLKQFCYVCGKFVFKQYRHNISQLDEEIYNYYFGAQMVREVYWAPDIICKQCRTALHKWWNEKIYSLPFGRPMEWDDPVVHQSENCYVCMNSDVFSNGYNSAKHRKKAYISVESAVIPLPHSDEYPVPKHPKKISPTFVTSIPSASDDPITDPNYTSSEIEYPSLISQAHLDSIVKKLHLSQNYAEILARELKSVHVLGPGVKVTGYRHRQSQFMPYFTLSDDKQSAFCNNIEGLMNEMNIDRYEPEKWRIFIDSSKTSLKTVLLYENSTIKPVPILYAKNRTETYETMEWILRTVDYDRHQWRACCDLKVVTLLAGMQTGYTKYCCAFCTFDSRYKHNQYQKRDW